jgi:hypothetical protein
MQINIIRCNRLPCHFKCDNALIENSLDIQRIQNIGFVDRLNPRQILFGIIKYEFRCIFDGCSLAKVIGSSSRPWC